MTGFCCSVKWSTTYGFIVLAVMAMALCAVVYQTVTIFDIQYFEKKSSDKIGSGLFVLGIMSNVGLSVDFGKPHSPMVVSGTGLLLSVFISLKYPGLWEWCTVFFSAAVPFLVGVQYFVNGILYGRT